MTPSTAEIFAVGYAQVTASQPVGLTERARNACRAAERVTEATPEPTGLPSLILGQLEGIWAVIYGRREAIEAAHAGAFKKILEAISKLDWDAIVSAVETQRLIDPSITGKMMAGELRVRISGMIAGDLPAADRLAWQSVVSEALVDGMAEGQTAAYAILNHASGAGIDWNLTGEEAKAALARGQSLGDLADAWIQKQTHGLGYQLGQQLSSLWDAGASRKDMTDAIQTLLGSNDNLASNLLDTAIGQSLSQGALDTYVAAGVERADFVTAGDRRVCNACLGAEDGNPYLLDRVPQPPLHVRCRCTLAPSDFFPSLSLVPSEDS